MTFVRASLLNAAAVVVRLLSALALNKVLALFVGPGGYALIGQFQNAMSILIAFASGATGQGVTKYTAEFFDNPPRLKRLLTTAGTITLGSSVILAGIIAGARNWLSEYFLHDQAYSSVFSALAAGLVFLAFNSLLLAIVNGKKDIYTFVFAGVAGSLIGLAVTVVLTIAWGLHGALTALAINQSVALVATLFLCRHKPWLQLSNFIGRIDPASLRALGGFVAMAATTAVVGPVSQIMVRQSLISSFGLPSAGHWEAMMRISSLYLLFFTSTLSAYYLPRISEIRCGRELRLEAFAVLRLLLPIVSLVSLLIWALRDLVVLVLFQPEFAPMRALFAFQMIGDTLKIASWVFAFVMIGRALARAYIITEVVFALLFIVATSAATHFFGFEGASLGYAVTYVIYLPTVYVIFNRYANAVPSSASAGDKVGDLA